MIHRDPYTAHIGAVDILDAAGISPPADWLALRERFTAATPDTCLDRLTAAILEGDRTADLTALHACAQAEALATGPSRAQVTNALKAAVGRRLRDLYAPVAQTNYNRVADQYDAAAAEFTTAATAVNPESDAAAIVSAPTKVRSAWTDAELAARKLDALVPPLQAAAELCGINTHTAEMLLPLLVDPAGHDRRLIWESFNHAGGRCGRWSALAAASVTIRAARPVTDLEPYRAAKPFEEKWVPTGRGQHQRIVIDPEAAPL